MKHKHYAAIKTWAEGYKIEVSEVIHGSPVCWRPCPNPEWDLNLVYRCAPDIVKHYKTLSDGELMLTIAELADFTVVVSATNGKLLEVFTRG